MQARKPSRGVGFHPLTQHSLILFVLHFVPGAGILGLRDDQNPIPGSGAKAPEGERDVWTACLVYLPGCKPRVRPGSHSPSTWPTSGAQSSTVE